MRHPDPSAIRELVPTGTLRVVLNMGNPVLARSHTSTERPAGVTIDLARRLAEQLGCPVVFTECESAAVAGAALGAGDADLGFMAIDPKRAEVLHFTEPYARIEGCYAVRQDAPLQHPHEVDAPGVRVVVGAGSAYGLFLHRHLQRAELVDVPTSEEVVKTLLADPSLQVAAGVRQQLEADLQQASGLRLLPEAFMVINQAAALPVTRAPAARELLEGYMREQRAGGAIAQSMQRHGMHGVTVLG